MGGVFRLCGLALGLFLVASPAALSALVTPSVERSLVDGVLVSDALPEARFTVAADYRYIGAYAMILKDKAIVERHHWARTAGNRIESLIILQFERPRDGLNYTWWSRRSSRQSNIGKNRWYRTPIRRYGAIK